MAVVGEKKIGESKGNDIVLTTLSDDGGKTFYDLRSVRLKGVARV